MDLNEKPKMINILGKKNWRNSLRPRLGRDFFDTRPKAFFHKKTNCSIEFHQNENTFFLKTKGHSVKTKGQATHWKHMFASHISGKEFMSRLYKESSKHTNEKSSQTTQFKKWTKKRLIKQRVGEVVEKQVLLHTTGGSRKQHNHFGKQFGSSLKFGNMQTM